MKRREFYLSRSSGVSPPDGDLLFASAQRVGRNALLLRRACLSTVGVAGKNFAACIAVQLRGTSPRGQNGRIRLGIAADSTVFFLRFYWFFSFWLLTCLPLLPPPERSGRFGIRPANCLSAASFCRSPKRLRSAGNPAKPGGAIGAPFWPYLLGGQKVGRRAGPRPRGLEFRFGGVEFKFGYRERPRYVSVDPTAHPRDSAGNQTPPAHELAARRSDR